MIFDEKLTLEVKQTWDAFLAKWPVERVRTMSLDEYSNPGTNDSFTYWLEFGTMNLGSIRGGDSSKFGIYRRNSEPKGERSHIKHGEKHSWKHLLGDNEQQAFETIKSQLIEVIEAVQNRDLDRIEASPLPNTVKWKTAYLYQNRQEPCVLSIYKASVLLAACGAQDLTVAQANRMLIEKMPQGMDINEYTYQVWYENQPQEDESITDLKQRLQLELLDDVKEEKLLLLKNLAWMAHEAGLDIYPTAKSNQLKIGRKDLSEQGYANGTLCRVNLAKSNIKIAMGNNSGEQVERREDLTSDLIEELRGATADFLAAHPITRTGLWPRDYLGLNDADHPQVANDMMSIEQATNQILYGPPGTGKTYHLQQIEQRYISAPSLHDESQQVVKRYSMTTFHQSYGYEEFIEGLKAETDENGNIRYSIVPGVFLKLCQRANADPAHRYAIFIDEINRGNISKIFGELISLIELDKRSGCENAMSIKLAYSGREFSVPSNVDIVGTMNTADRSLAMMDTALRRRFDFIEMMPKPELLAGCIVKGVDLEKLLSVLNQRIEILYDREHMLGHAFFMPVKKALEESGEQAAFSALVLVFQNKIIPLLEEYFFEDWEKIRLVLGDNQKDHVEHLQFIQKIELKSAELRSLFGKNHSLEQYGQTQVQYSLARFESSVWATPQAYKTVYSVVDNNVA
ncbi:TPA: McrB family protein [Vibrio vulnificus]